MQIKKQSLGEERCSDQGSTVQLCADRSEVSLNLDASDTFIPQNTTLMLASPPSSQPHPWPQEHSSFCTPKTATQLPSSPHESQAQCGWVAARRNIATGSRGSQAVLGGAHVGETRRPGGHGTPRLLHDRGLGCLGLGSCWDISLQRP